jgi:hypothetical protein
MGKHCPRALELAPKGTGQEVRGTTGGRLDPDLSTIREASAVIANRVVRRQGTARHQKNGGTQPLKPNSQPTHHELTLEPLSYSRPP